MSVREGNRFRRVLAEIDQSQWYGPEEFQELQRSRALRVVRHAARTVPYYQELFQQNRWQPEEFRDLSDLKQIPILTKKDVVRDPSRFVSKAFLWPRFEISTSGTTGTPLTISEDINAIVRENAFIWRHLEWAGFESGQRRAWLRGDMVVPIAQRRPPFWRYNKQANMLMMSSYHISALSAQAYIEALNDFDPHLILAYPSSIGLLAGTLKERGKIFGGKSLRSIVTSSEMLTSALRLNIEERFRCRIFDHYGSSERVAIIGTCEAGCYHVEPDYSYVELEEAGDGACSLVGTAFNNMVMPLIRYDLGDRVTGVVTNASCACGRRMPRVESVEGRMDDYIVTADGRRIGRLDHVFKDTEHVFEAQIRQDSVGEVRILVVPSAGFSERDEVRIIENTRNRIGPGTDVKVELTQDIPRGPNGKFRAVVCNVA